MQASPISARAGGVPVVIGGGKMGYVYAINSQTEKLVWKTPVGEHNGHDDDSLEALQHRSTAGEIEALDLATGKVDWATKVPQMPLGAATVANDLVFTTLYDGTLLALNRDTGAIVYRRQLPTSTNSPISIAGSTVVVPAGGPVTSATGGGQPQVVAYAAP